MIYVIAFDPIRIQTCLAPQNDRQNPSFVKDNYVLGQKMTRNVRKLVKRKSCQFFKSPVFNIHASKFSSALPCKLNITRGVHSHCTLAKIRLDPCKDVVHVLFKVSNKPS